MSQRLGVVDWIVRVSTQARCLYRSTYPSPTTQSARIQKKAVYPTERKTAEASSMAAIKQTCFCSSAMSPVAQW